MKHICLATSLVFLDLLFVLNSERGVAGEEGRQVAESRGRSVFSRDERAMLEELVGILGNNDWTTVASYMPGRDARQCRDYWGNYIKQSPTPTGPWSKEEDAMLAKEYRNVGPRWAVIARSLPGRSALSVQNRFKCSEEIRRHCGFLNRLWKQRHHR
jgi:hypothetical protein